MTTIYIDNRPYDARPGTNLLHACLELGFDIPYFCWHPAMHSVGACRLCAVKRFRDAKDGRGRIVMSCTTAVEENMRISIDDPEVKDFRAGIIELLMLNHPHDCPVCDEGGECHLQDMTLMTGHVARKYRFAKRTFRNQDLGPFLNHEMNRCIHCYRCVRFYRDYAGGRDFEALASHRRVYFGRRNDGALENAFSGNLVEICPTGTFTDKTFKRHFTRTWDLQTAPSLCIHCGLGCNTMPGERYGVLRRIRNRYNGEVNGYFLCDRGRFGYEFVNHPLRIRRIVMKDGTARGRGEAGSVDAGPASAEGKAREVLSFALRPGARVMGIGSPRASLEANYALRALVGKDRFSSGMSGPEARLVAEAISILCTGPARPASLHDVALSDAVLILGEDVTNTAPRMALALRQAVRNKPMEAVRKRGIPDWNDTIARVAMQQERGPLFIAAPTGTALDELAERTCRTAPEELARLGFAVAHVLDASSPPVPDMGEEGLALARAVAAALRDAEHPLVISGVSLGSGPLLHAAANVAWALSAAGADATLSLVMPECNSLGLGLMGAEGLDKAFAAAAAEGVDTLIVLENDLYRRAEEDALKEFLQGVENVIVIDSLEGRTAGHADILLPAASWAESTGTLVNSEGRAQRFYKVFVPAGEVRESTRWLRDMLSLAGRAEGRQWETVDDISDALAGELAVFAGLPKAFLPANFREAGQKIPRQGHRASGRTAVEAERTIHEPQPPGDPDSPLAFSLEGYGGMPPPSLLTRYWFPGWNSVQALTKFQEEIGGPLRGGNPGVRLIASDRAGSARPAYFRDLPSAFGSDADEWLFVARPHIFGSEELSAFAPAVAELSPGPYVALNPDDAGGRGLAEGDEADVTLNGKTHCLPVRVDSSLPRGIAGLPVGLPSLTGVSLPARGRVLKAASEIETTQ